MKVEEKDGWLFVKLEPEDLSSDLDWNRLIRWKLPQPERVYIAEIDTWIVQSHHRRMVESLFDLYRKIAEADPDPECPNLQEAQRLLEQIAMESPREDTIPEEAAEAGQEGEADEAEGGPWIYPIGLN